MVFSLHFIQIPSWQYLMILLQIQRTLGWVLKVQLKALVWFQLVSTVSLKIKQVQENIP